MENARGYADPAKTADTDAFVSDSFRAEELGVNLVAENAKLMATSQTSTAQPDMTSVMMEMMKTMQSMQKQLNELKADKPVVVKATKKPTSKSAKTKTSA